MTHGLPVRGDALVRRSTAPSNRSDERMQSSPDEDAFRLGIVIVTYNSEAVVARCLDGLMDYNGDLEVVIVDNASLDATVDVCRRHPLTPRVIARAINPGFADSVNLGAASLFSGHLLLLNPDAVVQPDALRALSEYLRQHDDVGVVGPRVIERTTDRTIPSGYAPTICHMLTHMSGASRCADRWPSLRGHYLLRSQVHDVVDVDWVTGACLLTKRSVWEELGGLTTEWFMYAEDIEYCLRVRALGLKVTLLGAWDIEHLAGRSSDTQDQRLSTTSIEHLYELYDTRLSPSPAHSLTWRATVAAGFGARAILARQPYDRKRFRAYAACLIKGD